jgi:competence protein ComEC
MLQLPFLSVLLSFITGIFIQQVIFTKPLGSLPWILMFCLLLLFALSAFLKSYFLFKNQWLAGLLSLLFVGMFGYCLSASQINYLKQNHYSKVINDSSIVEAVVLQPITKKPNSYKTIIRIIQVVNTNQAHSVQGEAFCYFTKMDSMPRLIPGNVIIFSSKFMPIQNNGNIGEFDYKSYCLRKDILHSCFISKFQFIPLAKNNNSFLTICANWRIATINKLKKYILNPNALGIAEALLIGDRTDIDQETWDTYSRTGIVHIIAISGMHMGIIYIGILGLLAWIPFFKKRKMLAIIIAISSMWIFACITGLPASVMRAAVMFSIIAGGTLLQRESNGFNALLASAFILLCYNTKWLQDVGFQLSYAAVIGIMIFAKPIQNILYVKNKLGLQLWKLIAGTLAAQIFTFPLCLYYFHQFPLIFLLSNIIAIPLTSIILYAEIFLLLISIISESLPLIVGKVITFLILTLNKSIAWLSKLENITIYNVHCNAMQTFLLFAFVCFAILAIKQRKFHAGLLSLVCVMLFYVIQIFTYSKANNQSKFIVYHVPKKNIISIIQGHHYQLISMQEIKASDVKNAVEPSLINFACANKSESLMPIFQVQDNYLYMHNNTLQCIILGKNTDSIKAEMPCKYVVLTQNSKASIAEIATKFHPQTIIADGSNTMWKIEQWQKEAKDLHLHFFSTPLHGAFVANL